MSSLLPQEPYPTSPHRPSSPSFSQILICQDNTFTAVEIFQSGTYHSRTLQSVSRLASHHEIRKREFVDHLLWGTFNRMYFELFFGELTSISSNYWIDVFRRLLTCFSTGDVGICSFVLATELVNPTKRGIVEMSTFYICPSRYPFSPT
ncbi:hypothetical protein L2E82_29766 [Cichorium intybus]|uniref:Uncharacterized protein n=1 Tax=Cichorium intybus TaxID=13427 RepID=A0ACB9CYU2_CICIN|nr:hypothetical protein L2E82_29766 [Cichorium intybus]